VTSVLDHSPSISPFARRRLGAASAATLAVLTAAGLLLDQSGTARAAAAIGLGTADSFAVLAGAGISNTGTTVITGDIGSDPTPSITAGISVTGAQNPAGTAGAKNDLTTAYTNAAGQTFQAVGTELGGTQLTAGVYRAGTLGLTGTLTLNAQGNADAVFVFQAGTTLVTETGSTVALINGAQACNVFWQVGSSATLKAGSVFVGNVLADQSISLQAGTSVQGRLLASVGAVTLISNTITRPGCTTGGSGGSGSSASGSGGSGTNGGGQVRRVPVGSVDAGDGSSLLGRTSDSRE
jgi:hypothetical protein